MSKFKIHDPKDYYDERTAYDLRDKRYYAAKYVLVLQAELDRLAAVGLCNTKFHAQIENRKMYYLVRFENTFED